MDRDIEFAFDLDIALEAARRWRNQKETMRGKERAAAKGQYDAVDSKERLAKRANRLLRSLRDAMPETYVADEGLRTIMEQPAVEAEDIDNVTMERIIGRTKDLLAIHFFDYGKRASQSVCRLVTKLGGGRVSYGTGFMVSPALLLTNHHVLEDAGMAAATIAQFRYEPGERGSLPTPEEFDLRPDRFFLNDKDLDFALVAVASTSRNRVSLGEFGFCPLIAAEGKIVPGEPVNIIQHPLGQPKQVVIRENKLLDLPKPADWDPKLDRYAQYEADTERGPWLACFQRPVGGCGAASQRCAEDQRQRPNPRQQRQRVRRPQGAVPRGVDRQRRHSRIPADGLHSRRPQPAGRVREAAQATD